MSEAIARCLKCRRALWTDELAAGCWACRRCEEAAARHLRELPDLFRKADHTAALVKGSRTDVGGGHSAGSSAPVKIQVLSLTANGGAVTTLQAIEDAWRATLTWSMGETRHRADIDGATGFLINNLRWACESYPEIADDLHAIERLHGQFSSIDTGEQALRRIILHCATEDCDGRIPGNINSKHGTCPKCGHEYDRDSLMRLDSDWGPNTIRNCPAA